MSVFRSQFTRARQFTDAYAGSTEDSGLRTPAVAAALLGAGLVGVAAVAAASDGDAPGAAETADGAAETGAAWGEGWESGWTGGYAGGVLSDPAADGDAWMDRGDYTDAGVGGDGDFFYFIDGDSSLTLG